MTVPPVRLFGALMDATFETVACPLAAEDADRLMRALTRAGVDLRDPRSPPTVLPGARAIVTGDKDLLHHQGLHPPAMTARSVRAGWPPLNRVAAFITDCQKTVATRRQRFR